MKCIITDPENQEFIPFLSLFGNGDQSNIYGLNLYTEVELQSSSTALGRLLRLISQGQLKVVQIIEANWSKTSRYTQDLQIANSKVEPC